MRFEWFLASRYFRDKRRSSSSFLSFIKIMAVAGIAIGAGGLLIAFSIVHGFKSVIQEKIMGYGAHITVTTYQEGPIEQADTLTAFIESEPGVEQAQPVIYGQGMIQSRELADGTFIKGVDREGDLTDIRRYITSGDYNLGMSDAGRPGVVIGSRLARNLDVEVGRTVTLYAIDGVPSPVNMPKLRQFHVTGIYSTGIDQFDDVMVLMDRQHARYLFQIDEPAASQIEIRVENLDDIEAVAANLSDHLSFPLNTRTIYQTYSSIFAWINLQEQTIPFVIAVMIIVAAFNLIGTILMMVLERTRDIGMLKTMGATNKHIKRIFLTEGMIVAAVGLTIGILLSVLFNFVQGTWEIIPLPEESYYMDAAPVEPRWYDFVIVTGATFVLAALASWLPARVASRMDPVRILTFGR